MAASYYRYSPVDNQSPAHNVHVGEVAPGGVYEVPVHLAGLFEGHPDWAKSTRQAFDTQDQTEESQ